MFICIMGHAVSQLLRCCATSPEVAGSIPNGVFGFIYNPSGRNMAPGSKQPLQVMSTRNNSWGKAAGT
jgi:hypothetical protein